MVDPDIGTPGLTAQAAAERLSRDGANVLPQADRRTAFAIVKGVLAEPMLALLLVGSGVYLVLGDIKEAVVLALFALFSVIVTVVQELRSEHVLKALRDIAAPSARVIRDAKVQTVPASALVRDDIILLAEGERIPADAVLLRAEDAQADESMLTGESVPVRKIAGAADIPAGIRPGGDDLPLVFSGTLIVRGNGVARVSATGAQTEIGKIGHTLAGLSEEAPRLKVQTRRLVLVFGVIGGAVSVLSLVLYGLVRHAWLPALLNGISIGMAMLPEEFPVVLTVFLTMGAWRISQARVLTRRAAAIETLGSATVLCTDKTGTLTENRMHIARLWRPGDGQLDLADGALPDGPFADLVKGGCEASAPQTQDPIEKAFFALGGDPETGRLVRAYALRPECLAMTQVWLAANGKATAAAKGAPETIVALCRLDPLQAQDARLAAETMASQGLRVLGVAIARPDPSRLPASQDGFDFAFMGLVGLIDPLRPAVAKAIADCRAAGIRVVMITGDHPATAQAIARRAGIDADAVVPGDRIERMEDADLAQSARDCSVFARIMPQQKLRIVEALKAEGDIVGMIGDGVNDAPSLKAAHIGVAMGRRGTDVAREAASLILLDDDFTAVVASIRLGRRIYDNLRKAMGFIVAVHIPIAGLALMPLLFGLPIVLGPVHVAFLEMIIDPVCSLVFEAEPEDDDIMRRPPRPPEQPLFSRRLLFTSLGQGLVVLAVTCGLYGLTAYAGMAEAEARSLVFATLVLSVFGLVLNDRARGTSLAASLKRANRPLLVVIGAGLIGLCLTAYLPLGEQLFHFSPLSAAELALALGLAGLTLVLGRLASRLAGPADL